MIDIAQNKVPHSVKTIHLTAICGTGMAALAAMLKDLGFIVTGSDQKVYPPMSTFLINRDITIMDGYHYDNLSHNPDLVVIGNAISKNNPEVDAIAEKKICYISMPQAINHFIAGTKKQILVTGTHGKTTTSALMAWILEYAGLSPSFMVGGILNNFEANYQLGTGNYMVIEGDEYDTAFFDKSSKFLHFRPAITILTSVEFDHADIFADFDHVYSSFNKLVQNISQNAFLFAYDGYTSIHNLIQNLTCQVCIYGSDHNSLWRVSNVHFDPPWQHFDVYYKQSFYGHFKSPLVGEHNLFNSLAAIGAAHAIGVNQDILKEALASFKGVKRRQEVRGVKNKITVIDDFAHHPTAVFETIKAVKPLFPKGRLITVFEPRTNTSMRNIFQEKYSEVFEAADLICVRHPPMLSKIPEKEQFSSEKLVTDLVKNGKEAYYFPDADKIIEFIVSHARPDDGILIMSNGGFENIHQRLLDAL